MGKDDETEDEKSLREDLWSRMQEKGLISEVYTSELEEFMRLYKSRKILQDRVDENGALMKAGDLTRCMTEIRQIDKTMRDIKDWLKIDPAEEASKAKNDALDKL